MSRRLACAAPVVLTLLSAAGCANVAFHAYHPDDHKVAQTAQTAFKDAALSKSLDAERAAIDKLLARELAAVRRDQVSLRDEKIAAFLTSASAAESWDQFSRDIQGRLAVLLGSGDPAKAAKDLRTIIDDIERSTRMVAQHQDGFYLATMNAGKAERVACSDKALQRTAPADSTAAGAWRLFSSACRTLRGAMKKLEGIQSGGGLLKQATGELSALDLLSDQLQAEVKSVSDAYDKAVAGYQEKVADADSPGRIEQAAASLKGKLAKLDAIADKATKAAAAPVLKDLGLGAVIEKLKRQKKAADDLLAAVAEGGAPPKEPSEKTSLLLNIAASVTAFEKAIDPKRHPQVAVLMLESEMLRLDLAAAEKRLARAKEAIAIVKEKRDVLLEEVRLLDRAHLRLESAAATSCPKKASLLKDYQDDKQGACRNDIAGALIAYSLSWELGRIPAEQSDYKRFGLDHQYALDQSEAALAQTEALIGAPLERLVALYGSGLKPEHLSNLIQAIGLGAIAVNVK